MRYKVDNEKPETLILNAGDGRDLTPKEKVVLSIGESKNVEILINGQRAHFDKSVVQSAVISKDTWRNYVQ